MALRFALNDIKLQRGGGGGAVMPENPPDYSASNLMILKSGEEPGRHQPHQCSVSIKLLGDGAERNDLAIFLFFFFFLLQFNRNIAIALLTSNSIDSLLSTCMQITLSVCLLSCLLSCNGSHPLARRGLLSKSRASRSKGQFQMVTLAKGQRKKVNSLPDCSVIHSLLAI